MSKAKKIYRLFIAPKFDPFQILEENINSYHKAIYTIFHKDTKSALTEDLNAIKQDGKKAIEKHKKELEASLCL